MNVLHDDPVEGFWIFSVNAGCFDEFGFDSCYLCLLSQLEFCDLGGMDNGGGNMEGVEHTESGWVLA